MKDIKRKLKNQLDQVFLVEPVDLGLPIFTSLYKKTTQPLKNRPPFLIIIPLSIILAITIYLILGTGLIKLTSLLQYGF